MRGLKGKNAVITGAAKGIGLGIAQRFAQEGVHVFMADVLADEVKKQAEDIAKTYGVKAEGYPVDLTDNEQIEAMMARQAKALGASIFWSAMRASPFTTGRRIIRLRISTRYSRWI